MLPARIMRINGKRDSKKNKIKSRSAGDNQNDNSFPMWNSPTRMGFSYCVMGRVKYKLISGNAHDQLGIP